jgi:hypothetical protein
MDQMPPEVFGRVVFVCFGRFAEYCDDAVLPDLIDTVDRILDFPETHRDCKPLLSLRIYLDRPEKWKIAVKLLNILEMGAFTFFQEEIFNNLLIVLTKPDLVKILNASLINGTRIHRTAVIQVLLPKCGEIMECEWQWDLVKTMLSVGIMIQKIACARAVLKFVNLGIPRAYLDELVVHALDSVDAKTRIELLSQIERFIGNANFPTLTDYTRNLERVLRAGDSV